MDNLDNGMKRKDFGPSDKAGPPPDSNLPKDSSIDSTQTTRVRRVDGVPVPATSMLFSNSPARAGQTPSVTELLLSVLRFKWTVLVVLVLVAAPLTAAIWTLTIPQYRARGEVQIRPIIRPVVFRTDDTGPIPFYDSFVNTQVAVMRNPDVLNRVLDQNDVRQTKWYREPQWSLKQRLAGQTSIPLERLKDALLVQPRRNTEIVDVSFSCASAQDAVVIVDAILDQYMHRVAETASGQKSEDDQARDGYYQELKAEIANLELLINGLHQRLRTATPQELISSRRLRLDETEARIEQLDLSIALLDSRINQSSPADSYEVINPAQPPYDQDADWRVLNENVRAMRHQIATSMRKSKHPDMVRLTKDLDYAIESLRLRETYLDEQWANQTLESVPVVPPAPGTPALTMPLMSPEEQLAQAKQEKKLLEEQYDKEKKAFDKLLADARELEGYNATLREKREMFDQVRQVREQKDVESSGVPGAISILTRASAKSEPSEDRRVVFTAMALFMGLAMGGGVAFLRASSNQTIYAPKDMPAALQAPFLGYIPLTRIRKSLSKSLHDEIQRMRDDKIESVRLVRTALLSRLNGQDSAAVLIASAAEGTGKSTFAVMLGKSLAQSGKRVIMIDADLRRMTLSKRFGLADEPGFIESLRAKSVDQRYIFATETQGLSILPAGIRNGDGSVFEGMADGAFKTCIGQLRGHFDIILLDSPPILPVADATILSSQVDGTIMVERELVSQRADVVHALARLDAAGGELMGTVFVGSRENGNYGYGYGYGYGNKQYS